MSYQVISQLEFEADAVNLKTIRNNLRHIFAEFKINKNIADDMVIALNEACMNIIQHAYGELKDKIDIEACSNAKKILIIIEKNSQHWRFELIDSADAVDISSIKPRDLNDVRVGGLGVSFIKQIMDKVLYQNINSERQKGNRLVLIKNIKEGMA